MLLKGVTKFADLIVADEMIEYAMKKWRIEAEEIWVGTVLKMKRKPKQFSLRVIQIDATPRIQFTQPTHYVIPK